ncbi:hypothetical protein CEXT_438581 [Caerostris extrusa]|uniref:Uncharacterized protein n=1 Tax=Caerostris extrusa TaxID=172846 RepID=A0AAV4MBE7_CAEEX|nr:hypothetical protein CEXT_438581 [Caerostris extrusa]
MSLAHLNIFFKINDHEKQFVFTLCVSETESWFLGQQISNPKKGQNVENQETEQHAKWRFGGILSFCSLHQVALLIEISYLSPPKAELFRGIFFEMKKRLSEEAFCLRGSEISGYVIPKSISNLLQMETPMVLGMFLSHSG